MTDLLPYMADIILQALLQAPDFDFNQYKYNHSVIELQSPQMMYALPCGPKHAAIQIIMGTVKIDESSYEGNLELIHEWLTQYQDVGIYFLFLFFNSF